MHFLSRLSLTFAAVLLCSSCAQRLEGTVSGRTYTGARGDYSVPFPVNDELDGRLAGDDRNGVTFTDRMGMRVSYYSYDLREGLPQKGRALLESFAGKLYPGVSTSYHPGVRGGTLTLGTPAAGGNPPLGAAFFQRGRHMYLAVINPPPAALFLGGHDEKPVAEQVRFLEAQALKQLQQIRVR